MATIGASNQIFYWSDEHKPSDTVIVDIPALKRLALAGILSRGSQVDLSQLPKLGKCLIPRCSVIVNSEDFIIWEYEYPKDSGHYVLNHGVWASAQCDHLIKIAYKEMKINKRDTY